jgi:hypothetical protein
MAEAIGQWGRQFPTRCSLLGRVGRGHNSDGVGEDEVAHGSFEHNSEKGGLDSWRSRRDLVEEEDALSGGS